MKKPNQKLAESVLRKYIQKEIRRMMEAEEETQDANAEGDQEEAPKKEEPKKPEPASKETPSLNPDFQAGLDQFIQKLKTSTDSVDHEDLVDMVGQLVDMFVSSNEGKLSILRAVKTNIVH